MSLKTSAFFSTALFAVGISSAFAATSPATATFQVKVTINKACTVVAGTASDIDFANKDANSTTGDIRSNSISVICSKKTPYNIGLQSQNLPANTTGGGEMRLTSGAAPFTDQKIAYQLQQTSGGTAWGSATGSRVTGTPGTGAAQSYTVFASVAGASWNVEPGNYTDTVTVDVSY